MLSLRLQFENKNSKSNIPTVFRIEAYIRCCIKITMLNLKGLTCQGGRMNPLEHHQVLWFQIVVSLTFYRSLYMMGASLSWSVKS